MAAYKIYVKDVPDTMSIWPYINEHSDIGRHYSMPSTLADPNDLINLKHELDIDSIIMSSTEMVEKFGFNPWQAADSDMQSYGGLSLVYNPDYIENVDSNKQTLGTKTNNRDEFFYGKTGKFKSTRNTYFDSYAFRQLAPCVTETSFNDIAQSFKRHIVRSRLATINAEHVSNNERHKFGWHRDESVFENLRINIPLITDETFMFEIKDKQAEHLSIGNIYSWDTNIPHRVFPTTHEHKSRTHLVLGFSPWFDYDVEEDCFYSNEFYGEMHPIDMLISGHVHEKIKGINYD